MRERNKMRQMTRLLYSWRYIDHARAEAGEPIPDHHQGFNLLTTSTPDKIRSTYAIAINTPMHWQVIVVGYIHDDEGEYRSWAWVKSERPIVAAGKLNGLHGRRCDESFCPGILIITELFC